MLQNLTTPNEACSSAASPPRSELQIFQATRPFVTENRRQSWWYFWSTGALIVALLTLAAVAPWWPLQLLGSLCASLVLVRGFMIYHDFMHGAVLRRSRVARIMLELYGYLLLVPARSWRKSHNFHHAKVGKVIMPNVGSFPLMTAEMWRQANWGERLLYRFSRSPLPILGAYPFIFGWSVTIEPLLKQPLQHWDSALSLLLHSGVIVALWYFGGPAMAFFAFVLPVALAAVLGAYLFYVQHTFPGMKVLGDNDWSNYQASMQTCSYLKGGRFMRWITGNIGFHHVHHVNLSIPFYRLNEAMSAIPELQDPIISTLHPRDIFACLRLKLWDEDTQTMIGYRTACYKKAA